MQMITLPKTDVNLSRLIYGVWRLVDDQDTSVQHIRRKIDICLDQGISSFDHADIYGDYACEAAFGQALNADPALRRQLQLITKCDIALVSDNYPQRRVKYYDTSATYIRQSVDNSLQHLHTDYIDVLLLHRPDPLMNAAETGQVLDELIQSGKIRAVGVSNFYPEDWRLLQSYMRNPLCVNQVEMNILERSVFVDGSLSAMQRDGLQPMAWSALAGGRLFNQGDDQSDAVRRVLPYLERLAQNYQQRVDLIALAWLLAHPAHILPVVGTNNLERIKGISTALDISIDRETWYEIWTATAGQEVP